MTFPISILDLIPIPNGGGGMEAVHNTLELAQLAEALETSDQLVSAGLGLRYGGGPYSFSADWGRLIVGSSVPVTVGASIPQSGDEKVHLNFLARF